MIQNNVPSTEGETDNSLQEGNIQPNEQGNERANDQWLESRLFRPVPLGSVLINVGAMIQIEILRRQEGIGSPEMESL